MDAQRLEQLRLGWRSALVGLRGDLARATQVFDDLARHYAEPGRCYHTLDHVWQMFECAFVLGPPPPPTLVLAVFLHDVICDSRAGDNEERSAEYALTVLGQLGVGREVCEETARLILLTKTHETTPADDHGQVLLDLDLAILGADESAYDAYAAAIRLEYAWVSEPDYRAGRRRVLERFLARPRLYFTQAMFERGERRARANLAREIATLA